MFICLYPMKTFSLFERSVRLDAPPAQVYAFHEDPRNITKISPPSLRVEKVECSVPARAGEEFRLQVRQFGLPIGWTGVWEEVVPVERLVDGARKSPFSHWRHSHLFSPLENGGGTLMTDRVEYALRFGPVPVSRFLDATVMRVVFTLMFLGRHKATRAFFASAGKSGG